MGTNWARTGVSRIVHFGLYPAIFHCHVQHEWSVQVVRFADVALK